MAALGEQADLIAQCLARGRRAAVKPLDRAAPLARQRLEATTRAVAATAGGKREAAGRCAAAHTRCAVRCAAAYTTPNPPRPTKSEVTADSSSTVNATKGSREELRRIVALTRCLMAGPS